MAVNETRTPATRVRERIERWIEMTGQSQDDFAKRFNLTLGWIQKVLEGKNDVRLADLDRIAAVLRSTASELVRTDEERYRLDLTPTEARIVEGLRQQPHTNTAVMILLRIPVPVPLQLEATSDDASRDDKARRRSR